MLTLVLEHLQPHVRNAPLVRASLGQMQTALAQILNLRLVLHGNVVICPRTRPESVYTGLSDLIQYLGAGQLIARQRRFYGL